MFFFHWSNTETRVVWKTNPASVVCRYCEQETTAIARLYQRKTKHYSAFSLGSGDFEATWTCRNCVEEWATSKEDCSYLMNLYSAWEDYNKLEKMRKKNPDKALKKINEMIESRGTQRNVPEMLRGMRDEWLAARHAPPHSGGPS